MTIGREYYVVMHYATVFATDGSVDKCSDAVTPTAGNMMDLMSAVKWALERVRKDAQEQKKDERMRIISHGDFHCVYENCFGDVISVRYEVVRG